MAATMRVRFAVVGGGLSGLAAAHRLVELGAARGERPDVAVLEASPRLGGQVRTSRRGPYLVEAGPDAFLSTKPGAVELCARLGLERELVRIESAAQGTRILVGRELRPLPDGFHLLAPTRVLPLLASSLFSTAGKLRVAAERFLPPRREGGDESLASFVRRRFGAELLDRVAEPVLASIFLADAERLSVGAALPRLVDLERDHGSVTRGVRRSLGGAPRPHTGGAGGFAYVSSGTGRLVERLVERLDGTAIRTGVSVERLSANGGPARWRLATSEGEVSADAVVLACPAPSVADALRAHDAGLAARIGRIAYASCATVTLGYRDADLPGPLAGLGFFVPRTEGLSLVACSFASRKFPGRAPSGETLLRVFFGGALRPDLAELGEGALVALAHAELAAVLGIRGEPCFEHVERFPRAMPQYHVGYPEQSRRTADDLDAHRGLFLAGGAAGAVGLPDAIRSGERAAEAAFAAVRE